jgi:CO/xanthine dehydrogenase FAD-binding subunit
MNLGTVTQIKRPTSADEVTQWRAGYAWLGGGTWLFSQPQPAIDTLIDLETLHWPALQASAEGLDIAATCRIVELDRFVAPAAWIAAPLLRTCCRSLLASFKIWNAATVGGNLANALPAGPMISLAAALDGRCTVWTPSGRVRELNVLELVTGDNQHSLAPGEVIRSITLPPRCGAGRCSGSSR